jgi:hypothetical protein
MWGDLPGDLDRKKANVARMYDAALGGRENFEVDRRAMQYMIEVTGGDIVVGMRQNRRFLGRAVRFLAEAGIEQFLDVGTGLPTQENVHEVTRTVNPLARVVYVDNDEVVIHGEALLTSTDRVQIINGDLRRPRDILRHPVVRSLIDFDEPVGVLLVAVLHFVSDAEDPAGILDCFREVMAPGSYLVLSHGTVEAVNAQAAAADWTAQWVRAAGRRRGLGGLLASRPRRRRTGPWPWRRAGCGRPPALSCGVRGVRGVQRGLTTAGRAVNPRTFTECSRRAAAASMS